MTELDFVTIDYEGQDQQVSWQGVHMEDGDGFAMFLTNNVASRAYDEEGTTLFESHIRGLSNTGFSIGSVHAILAVTGPERSGWAISEALAEAYLENECRIIWPWNMKRDMRNPNASLPGPDLIGFQTEHGEARLVLGEVKSSSDTRTPPNVMNGQSGMTHQLDNLANDLSLIRQNLMWLLSRCKGTTHEKSFNIAVKAFMDSENRAVLLFGVLIRDTTPNELDLQSTRHTLAQKLQHPTACQLIAIYLPCTITDLPSRVSRDQS